VLVNTQEVQNTALPLTMGQSLEEDKYTKHHSVSLNARWERRRQASFMTPPSALQH